MDDDEPPQSNWLISQIKNSKVAARLGEHILCRIGIHQGGWHTGPWPTRSCQQRRFCIYCGTPQDRKKHNWSRWEYFKDNSCEMRIRCYDCGKTKPGLKLSHEGMVSWRYPYCKRCGEYLGGDGGD